MKQFLMGSKYFFDKFEDFVPVDTDILIIEDTPEDYNITKSYMEGNTHYVRWKNLSKDELITLHKNCYSGRYIGKFLIPEICEYFNFTIEDLKELEILIPRLDEYHTYIKIIYNSYIKNNDFILSDEQLNEAYKEYKRTRELE